MKRRNSSDSLTSEWSTSSRVSFSDDVATKCIEPLEKEVAWYSIDEMQEFRRDTKLVVSAMRCKAITHDTDTTTTHGLDSQVNKELTRARREIARTAVLEVQDYQIQECHDINDEVLADVYFQVTRGNQLSALRRGYRHAKEVKDMWTC